MKTILCTLIVKDGGYEHCMVTPQMFGELAYAIQEKGSETVQLQSKSFVAAGIYLMGKDAGERVIFNYRSDKIDA